MVVYKNRWSDYNRTLLLASSLAIRLGFVGGCLGSFFFTEIAEGGRYTVNLHRNLLIRDVWSSDCDLIDIYNSIEPADFIKKSSYLMVISLDRNSDRHLCVKIL